MFNNYKFYLRFNKMNNNNKQYKSQKRFRLHDHFLELEEEYESKLIIDEHIRYLDQIEESKKSCNRGFKRKQVDNNNDSCIYKRTKSTNTFKAMKYEQSEADEKVLQHGASLFNIERSQVITGNSEKFNCNVYNYNVNFLIDSPKTFGELTTELSEMFIDLHSKMASLVTGKDKIRVLISHASFENPISFPFLSKEDFLNINLEDSFFSVIQSFRTVNVSNNDPLYVNVCLARNPTGGRKSAYIQLNKEAYRNSAFITKVINDDQLCSIYAVIIAIAKYELHHTRIKNLSKQAIDKYRNQLNIQKQNQSSNNQLKIEAMRFVEKNQLDINKQFGIEIFPILQNFYKNEYNIVVVSKILYLIFIYTF